MKKIIISLCIVVLLSVAGYVMTPHHLKVQVMAYMGSSDAMVQYAEQLSAQGNEEESFEWYQEAATLGNIDAAFKVAMAYNSGYVRQ